MHCGRNVSSRMFLEGIHFLFQSVLAVTTLLSGISAQVNSEIDQFEDLLAVDSFANEVRQLELFLSDIVKNNDIGAGDCGQTQA